MGEFSCCNFNPLATIDNITTPNLDGSGCVCSFQTTDMVKMTAQALLDDSGRFVWPKIIVQLPASPPTKDCGGSIT